MNIFDIGVRAVNIIHMKTFVSVAEAGSFNKAAAELFITSTAVIKQINLLEKEIGVRLFDRTHRGLVLTKSGESFYKDAKYIMEYSREAVIRAKNAMLEENRVIRIGTSPIMPAQLLMDLWPKIHERCSDISFKLVTFENTSENAREILKNLGQNIDVVMGFVDKTLMRSRNCAGLEITREPLCCAVSIYHPLAKKDRLRIEDLYGENLMLIHRGWCEHTDKLRNELEGHKKINIVNFDLYDVGIFNLCEQNKDVLIAIQSWDIIHPLMKVIPVEWDYYMPLGIMHSPEPSDTVERFLDALKAVI